MWHAALSTSDIAARADIDLGRGVGTLPAEDLVDRRTKGSGAVEFGQLVGQWRLVRARMYTRDGSTSAHMYGPSPNGVLLYTPDGGVSATIESPKGGMAVCYAGRVTLADSAVTHHVLVGGTRFLAGTKQVRQASFDSDGHLNLTVQYPDGAVQAVLVWQRAET